MTRGIRADAVCQRTESSRVLLQPPSAMAVLFRPSVTRAAAGRAEARRQVRAAHEAGVDGLAVCRLGSDLIDVIVVDVWSSILDDLDPGDRDLILGRIAVVAHGGYGRRQMAPSSDVDLMLLHDVGRSARATGVVASVAQRLLQDLFDAGFAVGQSVRTVSEAIRLAGSDATIFSTLLDTRLLSGAADLLARLQSRQATLASRGRRRLVDLLLAARREEAARYGDTVFLLQPNVKRSPGGLRDVQLAGWLERVGGKGDADGIGRGPDLLAPIDRTSLEEAAAFLTDLRVELHLHADRAVDELSRDEQVRIAAKRGIEAQGGLLGVERFMQEYFHRRVAEIVASLSFLVEQTTRLNWMTTGLVGHRVDGCFLIGRASVAILPEAIERVATSSERVIRLVELGMLYELPIEPSSWTAVRAATPQRAGTVDAAARSRFLGLVEQPGRLGEALRRLHEVEVLEAVIPDYGRARCLLQFNNYHKYTVDEHCILAVEKARELAGRTDWLGVLWGQMRRKRPLLLALLLHDLGKGQERDHSDVGAEIARRVAAAFELPAEEAEIIELLVQKHLVMAHFAFRRDVGDDSLIVGFAREVGSPEVLRMFTALTVADVSAVGPDVWNRWKADLLADLYFSTLRFLDDEGPVTAAEERRREVLEMLTARAADEPVRSIAGRLPRGYLRATPVARIVEQLGRLARLTPGQSFVVPQWQADSDTVSITVGLREPAPPGIFHRLTAALAGQRLEVLAADVHTLPEGFLIDHFQVRDGDYAGEPPEERFADVVSAMRSALAATQLPTPPRRWNPFAPQLPRATRQPPRVRFDNESSADTTILEVFAHDSDGLLAALARVIFEQGLSIQRAKIGTYLDQVVDCFHVVDRASGEKLVDPERQAGIRRALETVAAPVTGPGE